MILVDALISMGYPLNEVKQMSLAQAFIFFRYGLNRKNLDLAQQASNIRCAVWSEDISFLKYLEGFRRI